MSLIHPQAPLDTGDEEAGLDKRAGALQATGRDAFWLDRARASYESSTDYFDSSVRPTIERGLDNFNNQHPAASKYHLASYRARSRLFRPLTRSTGRRMEQAVHMALFANRDVVDPQPWDENDQEAKIASRIMGEVLNYRLQHTLPWFQICMNAFQDGYKSGVIISRQGWQYQSRMSKTLRYDAYGDVMINDSGEPVLEDIEVIDCDKPDVFLCAIENFRFDPAANWLDPVTTSPYIIELVPMFLQDVVEMLGETRSARAAEPLRFRQGVQPEMIVAASTEKNDQIARIRQGDRRQDPKTDTIGKTVTDHSVVWIHRNIQRYQGQDWLFYTAGTSLMLSDPVPLRQVYPWLRHRERPYVMGQLVFDSHINYPTAPARLGEDLQAAANDVQNMRFDNVKLVMNKRYRLRRGANVDLHALRNSVSGGAYEVDNVAEDVFAEEFNDVTSSAYHEQDRINADYDALMGSFSPNSVQTNRSMNETVGGMALMNGDAEGLTEYTITTGVKTWVEPVLDQLLRIEQYYETDQVILNLAKSKAEQHLKFGIDEITDSLLTRSLIMKVRVGKGATNPVYRVQQLTIALDNLINRMPTLANRLNEDEIAKEVFGAVGFDDGDRFLIPSDDPTYQKYMEQIQQLQAQLESKQVETEGKMMIEQTRGENAFQIEQLRSQTNMAIQEKRAQIDAINKQIDAEGANRELELQRDALLWQMLYEELKLELEQVTRGGQAESPAPGKASTIARDDYGRVPHAVG